MDELAQRLQEIGQGIILNLTNREVPPGLEYEYKYRGAEGTYELPGSYYVKESLLRFCYEYLYTHLKPFRQITNKTSIRYLTDRGWVDYRKISSDKPIMEKRMVHLPSRLITSPHKKLRMKGLEGTLADAIGEIGDAIVHEEIESYLNQSGNSHLYKGIDPEREPLRGGGDTRGHRIIEAYLWEQREAGFFEDMGRMVPNPRRSKITLGRIIARYLAQPWNRLFSREKAYVLKDGEEKPFTPEPYCSIDWSSKGL